MLGLSFSGHHIRILEVSENRTVTLLNEIKTDFDFSGDLRQFRNDNILIFQISERIQDILYSKKISIDKAGALIDTSQTFLNIIPVDFTEDKAQINTQIMWELSNYFPETYKDFSVNYYRLHNRRLPEGMDEILLIAVDKTRLEFIKKICKYSDINLKVIDIDHFAAEKCIRELYKGVVDNSNVIIIGCKKSRIDLSLICRGNFRYYDFINIHDESPPSLSTRIQDLGNFDFDTKPNTILIYGEEYSKGVLEEVRESFQDTVVELVNPLSKLDTDTDLTLVSGGLQRFTPVCGLAMKK